MAATATVAVVGVAPGATVGSTRGTVPTTARLAPSTSGSVPCAEPRSASASSFLQRSAPTPGSSYAQQRWLAYRSSSELFGRDAISSSRRCGPRPAGRRSSTRVEADRSVITASTASHKEVLIVNTNSGGHAIIGFCLAKALQSSGYGVTFLTVGEEASDKMKKAPFSRLSELREIGVKTIWGEPSAVGAAVGSTRFDVVVDNNGKDLEAVQPVADWAKATGADQFLFVSSAGIYTTSDEPPHVEGDAVKESAGHVVVEKYLANLFENWSSFRPQYITGSGQNKDCEEWFFDRIVRDRAVPIPGSGMQITTIGHAPDLANMIAMAVQKPEAAGGAIFNCVNDRGVTFDGLVRLCAKAAGKEASIVHYDPAAVGVDVKKAFPFRNTHFYAEPRAAKDKLGWAPLKGLEEVLVERFQEYVASGRDKKDISFPIDDKILEALKQPVTLTA